MDKPTLKPTITRFSAVLLVVSGIIGSGVFKKIAPMSDTLQSPGLILLCWLLAGILSIIGALCTAELVSMMPGSGGEYVYFRKIYGRFFSFLFGWANFTVMKAATIAALSYIFAESFNVLFPLPALTFPVLGSVGSNASIKIVATSLVFFLCFVNHRGLVFGEKLSKYLIASIVIVILSFVFAPFISDKGSVENFTRTLNPPEDWQLVTAIFAASLSAFWAYEGWNNIGYIGEEIKNPQKNLPIALGAGTLIVIFLYLLVNSVYLYFMSVDQLSAIHKGTNQIAAVEVARVISGRAGALVLSCLILLTTFTCTNSTILMASRIFYAMSRDGLFLKSAGIIHPKYNTPSNSIICLGAWATVLLWSGSFDQLTDLLIFASFIFYGSTTLGVMIMRKREPDTHRPYKVIGYPVLPIIFALFCLMLVCITIIQRPGQAFIGLMLISSGIPVYLYYVRKGKI
ncbi:MAG: APC family permease [Sphingobacteriaceae bacterium]